jgi:basic membrane protein A
MYQDGIDYIQTDAAATDTGIIQAANEGEGRMVERLAPAQYALGPKSVIDAWSASISASRSTTRCRRRSAPTSRAAMSIPGSAPASSTSFLSPVFVEQGPADLVAKAKEVLAGDREGARRHHLGRDPQGAVQHRRSERSDACHRRRDA